MSYCVLAAYAFKPSITSPIVQGEAARDVESNVRRTGKDVELVAAGAQMWKVYRISSQLKVPLPGPGIE